MKKILKRVKKYGFREREIYVYKSPKGLNEKIVAEISRQKKEPFWMKKLRLKALRHFQKMPLPKWGADLSGINFSDIYYYLKPVREKSTRWENLPPEIKRTYEKLGIPEAERRLLIGGANLQYESEVIYENLKKDLLKKGVIFTDMDTALQKYPEIVRAYFGRIVPFSDNKFAALNTAVWSGGSFVYVPPNTKVELPLQAYFRINSAKIGQFERTIIIADKGSFVHYVEGCTAPF
jgi:Fe-S cluster assembly protein SufB